MKNALCLINPLLYLLITVLPLLLSIQLQAQHAHPHHDHIHGHKHKHGNDHGHYHADKGNSNLNKVLQCHANINALPTAPACDNHLNYAPQSGFEEHTPIKEIKLVMHVIQQEPPLAPGNFTDDPDDVAFFQSLVHDPNFGFNIRFANLCAPLPIEPNNPSPHISDSRIRFLFDGIPGQDIFYHQDNNAYDGGFRHPDMGGNGVEIGPTCDVYDEYIENNAALSGDQLNALHLLWIQCCTFNGNTTCNTLGGLGFPDAIDGIPFVGQQGFFSDPPPVIDHNLTRGIIHELAVALGLFHAWNNDRCDDTPQGVANATVPNNYMSHHVDPNNPNDRCSFTECQLARMHFSLATTYSNILRNTDKCSISEPDIVIPNGADVEWSGPRNISSNIIIESGGKLTINCDLGMPENARITVRTGGFLVVNNARIHNNCNDTFWDGIVVEGDPNLGDLTNFQGFCRLNYATIENAYIGVRCQDGVPGANT